MLILQHHDILEEEDPKLEEYLLVAEANFQKSTFRKIISKLKMIEKN